MGMKVLLLLVILCAVSTITSIVSATLLKAFIVYETGKITFGFVCMLLISLVVLFGIDINTTVFSLKIDSVASMVARAFSMLRQS